MLREGVKKEHLDICIDIGKGGGSLFPNTELQVNICVAAIRTKRAMGLGAMPDTPEKLVADLCEVIDFLEDRSAARPLTSPEASGGHTPSGRPASARPFPTPQGAAPHRPPLGGTHTHTP